MVILVGLAFYYSFLNKTSVKMIIEDVPRNLLLKLRIIRKIVKKNLIPLFLQNKKIFCSNKSFGIKHRNLTFIKIKLKPMTQILIKYLNKNS